jgi:hypothetical protein
MEDVLGPKLNHVPAARLPCIMARYTTRKLKGCSVALARSVPPYLFGVREQVETTWNTAHHNENAMQSKIRLSLAANTKHERRASFQDSVTCPFIKLLYRSHTVCSSVKLATVLIAPIASVAYLALAANTLLFRTSNLISCRTRYHPPARMIGSDDTITTVANFQ